MCIYIFMWLPSINVMYVFVIVLHNMCATVIDYTCATVIDDTCDTVIDYTCDTYWILHVKICITCRINPRTLYHPTGRWPLGWYRFLWLIRHVIQNLTCNIQYVLSTIIIKLIFNKLSYLVGLISSLLQFRDILQFSYSPGIVA